MRAQPELESIEGVRAFHSHLRQLIAAKVPICLELSHGGASTKSMESLQSGFESHAASQGTIESYLSNSSLPTAYRVALGEWLQGAPTAALDRLTAGAEGQRFFQKAIGFVLLQALLILSCVFLGMVGVCYWLLPTMQQIQADSFAEPGLGLRIISSLREKLPYWGLLLPISACVALLFRRVLAQRFMALVAPMREDSHALSAFQGFFSIPARFQWFVSLVVIACGCCVLLQALSVLGVTIELLMQLVAP